ncbi:hypothetical protein BT96DRAFT_996524 [Gymnopus androsaceus JB14]|uniref:Uncharacterized protein n=1 Tax=Gymnopus androsaceus JB14 TaxID=1447944 RepID=A0A6A4HE22_9AGAR|nr:hypothetical protein BT96DRAFT_996524 [Gymnopus androsaceus JB14]
MLGAPLRLIASEEEAKDIGCDQITSVLNARHPGPIHIVILHLGGGIQKPWEAVALTLKMSRADVDSVEIFKPAAVSSAQQAGTNLRQSRRERERERKHLTSMNIVEILTSQRRGCKTKLTSSNRVREGHPYEECKCSSSPDAMAQTLPPTPAAGPKTKDNGQQKFSKTYTASLNCGIGIPGRRLKAETPVEDEKFTVLGGVHTAPTSYAGSYRSPGICKDPRRCSWYTWTLARVLLRSPYKS